MVTLRSGHGLVFLSNQDCDSLVCHVRFITVLTDCADTAQCGCWPWSRHCDAAEREGIFIGQTKAVLLK